MKHLFCTGVEQYRNRYRTYFKRFSVENLSRKSQSFLQKLTIDLFLFDGYGYQCRYRTMT